MRLRVNMKQAGGHVHCTFWTCEHSGDTFANCGTIVIGEVDANAFTRTLLLGTESYQYDHGAIADDGGDIDTEDGRTITLDTRTAQR